MVYEFECRSNVGIMYELPTFHYFLSVLNPSKILDFTEFLRTYRPSQLPQQQQKTP